MKRIDACLRTGDITFQLDDGRYLKVTRKDIDMMGIEGIGRLYGQDMSPTSERRAVLQNDRRIGSVPVSFDPLFIKSSNWLYEPRPGDFRLDGETWVAAANLCPGDLEAVPGFQWEPAQ